MVRLGEGTPGIGRAGARAVRGLPGIVEADVEGVPVVVVVEGSHGARVAPAEPPAGPPVGRGEGGIR